MKRSINTGSKGEQMQYITSLFFRLLFYPSSIFDFNTILFLIFCNHCLTFWLDFYF